MWYNEKGENMQQYMISNEQIENNTIKLTNDNLHHIFKVMRMKENDCFYCVSRDDKKRYLCQITNDKQCQIKEDVLTNNELPKQLILAFGLVKADKLEFVIQKACELGVSKFIPLKTKNSIVKFESDKLDKKMIRWQKIIEEASEQAKRNSLMEITLPKNIEELKEELVDVNLVAYEKETATNKLRDHYDGKQDCLVVVGPEGGFDQVEINELEKINIKPISLGKRILRCETAAISVVSIISDLME